MDYVQQVKAKNGKVYLYFRKDGVPRVALKSPLPPEGEEEGSPLKAEVDALLALAPEPPAPSTLGAALKVYEKSAGFLVLGGDTKYEYGLIIKELDEDFGRVRVEKFVAYYLLVLQNTWALRGHRCAEMRLLILRHALLPSMIAGKIEGGDPFALLPPVPRAQKAGEPHLIWPEAVVMKAIARALRDGKVGLARGIALGRYSGARRGDIVKMTRNVRRAGKLKWLSGKRRVPVDIQEDAALTAVLDNTPNYPRSLVLAYNLSGHSYSEDGLGLEIGKIITALFEEGEIETDAYNIHGLRHTFGVEAALAGCTDAEGAARMGHKSASSFVQYRRQAERIRLSANADEKLAEFRERTSNGELKNDLENLCKTGPRRVAKARGKNAAKSIR